MVCLSPFLRVKFIYYLFPHIYLCQAHHNVASEVASSTTGAAVVLPDIIMVESEAGDDGLATAAGSLGDNLNSPSVGGHEGRSFHADGSELSRLYLLYLSPPETTASADN